MLKDITLSIVIIIREERWLILQVPRMVNGDADTLAKSCISAGQDIISIL